MATKKERPAPPKAPKSRPAAKAQSMKPQSTFTGDAQVEVSPEELRKLISEAAYFRAKQRGFTPGYELEDWIQAEAEVMNQIGSRSHRSA